MPPQPAKSTHLETQFYASNMIEVTRIIFNNKAAETFQVLS